MSDGGRVEPSIASTADKVPILLLKTKSAPTDTYEEYFVESGLYAPEFIPVFEHVFHKESLTWLRHVVESGGCSGAHAGDTPDNDDVDRFGGIIFTSQRAVEAFAQLVESLDPVFRDTVLPSSLPLYVVGPATARGLRALNTKCQILGEHTGNGEALAAFILDHYNSLEKHDISSTSIKLPLLFLVGEQRRDIIPKTLESPGLPVERRIGVTERTIYETGELQSFEKDFTKALADGKSAGATEQWVVVFSPTGCKAMLRSLGWLDETTQRYEERQASLQNRGFFIATIGPTTRDYLDREFGFLPHVCAARPSAEGVGNGISEYRKSLQHFGGERSENA